jgi:hypothetical protein
MNIVPAANYDPNNSINPIICMIADFDLVSSNIVANPTKAIPPTINPKAVK